MLFECIDCDPQENIHWSDMWFPPFLVAHPSHKMLEQFFKMPRSNTPIAILLCELWADDVKKQHSHTLHFICTVGYLYRSVYSIHSESVSVSVCVDLNEDDVYGVKKRTLMHLKHTQLFTICFFITFNIRFWNETSLCNRLWNSFKVQQKGQKVIS